MHREPFNPRKCKEEGGGGWRDWGVRVGEVGAELSPS